MEDGNIVPAPAQSNGSLASGGGRREHPLATAGKDGAPGPFCLSKGTLSLFQQGGTAPGFFWWRKWTLYPLWWGIMRTQILQKDDGNTASDPAVRNWASGTPGGWREFCSHLIRKGWGPEPCWQREGNLQLPGFGEMTSYDFLAK